MRNLIYFLSMLVFLSCSKDNEINQTPNNSLEIAKGVFGLRDASKLTELGAEYTRILVWDTDVKAIYNQVDNGIPLENIQQYQQVKSIFESGVKIILTLRWPDQNSVDPALYDRVPVSQDKTNSINLLRRFLSDFGPIIDIYSIQNEVGGTGPGTYLESDMQNNGNGSPAVNWWTAIVETINTERINSPNLTHLKISSPTPILLKRLVFNNNGLPQTNIDFFYESIEFGNNYCDYIDFHFNTYSLDEYQTTLNFINPLVNKPMISTEWSEVSSANIYVSQPISNQLRSFANSLNYSFPATLTTNNELIEYIYDNPSSKELWSFIVDESNYHEGFMSESSKMLASSGFKVICWTSGWQQGLTAYDLRSFYATKTVFNTDNELLDLITEFKNLNE